MANVFFEPNILSQEFVLSEEESRHCIKVCRLKKGDEIIVTDGKGLHALCVIIDDNFKKCRLRIINQKIHPNQKKYNLSLYVAPAKNTERNEWLVEKATEAGIYEITFIETKNGVRDKINTERLQKIAISAIKQSKQWWLPKINKLTAFETAIKNTHQLQSKFIAKVGSGKSIKSYHKFFTNHIAVFIGPEGDFTNEEMSIAKTNGFNELWLGNSILRTETAALFVCMALKALLETED